MYAGCQGFSMKVIVLSKRDDIFAESSLGGDLSPRMYLGLQGSSMKVCVLSRGDSVFAESSLE